MRGLSASVLDNQRHADSRWLFSVWNGDDRRLLHLRVQHMYNATYALSDNAVLLGPRGSLHNYSRLYQTRAANFSRCVSVTTSMASIQSNSNNWKDVRLALLPVVALVVMVFLLVADHASMSTGILDLAARIGRTAGSILPRSLFGAQSWFPPDGWSFPVYDVLPQAKNGFFTLFLESDPHGDPLTQPGTPFGLGIELLVWTLYAVLLALCVARRTRWPSSPDSPVSRSVELFGVAVRGLRLFAVSAPAFVICYFVWRPIAWAMIWMALSTPRVARVEGDWSPYSCFVAAGICHFLCLLAITHLQLRAGRLLSRRPPKTWPFCQDCKYPCAGLARCPECGAENPCLERRGYLTDFGAWLSIRIGRSRLAFIVAVLLLAAWCLPLLAGWIRFW